MVKRCKEFHLLCAPVEHCDGRHRFTTSVDLNSVRWWFAAHKHSEKKKQWQRQHAWDFDIVVGPTEQKTSSDSRDYDTDGNDKKAKYIHSHSHSLSHSHSHVCIISVVWMKNGSQQTRVFRHQRNTELTHSHSKSPPWTIDISIKSIILISLLRRAQNARPECMYSNVWWSMRPLFTRIMCPFLLLKRFGLSERWLSLLFGTTFHFVGVLSHHHKHHHHRWRCRCCYPSFRKLNITQRMHITHLPSASFWIYIFPSL